MPLSQALASALPGEGLRAQGYPAAVKLQELWLEQRQEESPGHQGTIHDHDENQISAKSTELASAQPLPPCFLVPGSPYPFISF